MVVGVTMRDPSRESCADEYPPSLDVGNLWKGCQGRWQMERDVVMVTLKWQALLLTTPR